MTFKSKTVNTVTMGEAWPPLMKNVTRFTSLTLYIAKFQGKQRIEWLVRPLKIQ